MSREPLAERGRALAGEVRELLPSFQPRPRTLRRTLKSIVIAGDSGAGPVLCKKLVHADPLWRWYFARELELYRGFATELPPVRVPRPIASDPERQLLIVEELPGPPLARLRRAAAGDDALVAQAVALCTQLAGWTRGLALAPSAPPPAALQRALRSRLLEDPSAPVGWVRDGVARGVALGLCDAALASAVLAAIEAHPRTTFAHGDLLPRNLLRVDGGLAPVDWECAGSYLEGWDRALLWVNLPAARSRIEATFSDGGAGRAAFWACAGFALVRELKFRRARPGDPRADELRVELERVRRELGRA